MAPPLATRPGLWQVAVGSAVPSAGMGRRAQHTPMPGRLRSGQSLWSRAAGSPAPCLAACCAAAGVPRSVRSCMRWNGAQRPNCGPCRSEQPGPPSGLALPFAAAWRLWRGSAQETLVVKTAWRLWDGRVMVMKPNQGLNLVCPVFCKRGSCSNLPASQVLSLPTSACAKAWDAHQDTVLRTVHGSTGAVLTVLLMMAWWHLPWPWRSSWQPASNCSSRHALQHGSTRATISNFEKLAPNSESQCKLD